MFLGLKDIFWSSFESIKGEQIPSSEQTERQTGRRTEVDSGWPVIVHLQSIAQCFTAENSTTKNSTVEGCYIRLCVTVPWKEIVA